MARHEHLPIYKAALYMRAYFEKLVAGFSRYHKYALGTELRQGSRAVLMQVLRANDAATREHRATELIVLRDRIEALLMDMRVADLVAVGRAVTFVAQRGESGGGLLSRVPVARWVANDRSDWQRLTAYGRKCEYPGVPRSCLSAWDIALAAQPISHQNFMPPDLFHRPIASSWLSSGRP